MQLMPSEGGDFQYRIRNVHERVVKENGSRPELHDRDRRDREKAEPRDLKVRCGVREPKLVASTSVVNDLLVRSPIKEIASLLPKICRSYDP
jgi:hypothetical protein